MSVPRKNERKKSSPKAALVVSGLHVISVGNQCMILYTDFIWFSLLLFILNKHHVLSMYRHNCLCPFFLSFFLSSHSGD